MEVFAPYLGNVISGLALSWTIYVFFTAAREKRAAKDREDFNKTFSLSTSLMEKQITELKLKIDGQEKEFNNLKTAMISQAERMKTLGYIIDESGKRVDKALERHEQKLDVFGRVIKK